MAGIAHFHAVNHRIDFPPVQMWESVRDRDENEKLRSSSQWKCAGSVVAVSTIWSNKERDEPYQEMWEFLLTLGIPVSRKDRLVLLWFQNESAAYCALKYLSLRACHAVLVLEGLQICGNCSLDWMVHKKAYEIWRSGEPGYPANVRAILKRLENAYQRG